MIPSSRFDPQDGRLTLSLAGLGALPALVSGDASSLDATLRHDLERGGILSDGTLHHRLVSLGRCIAAAAVRVSLDRVSGGAFHLEGWVDDRLAVLMRTAPEATVGDVIAIPRGMLPFRLAALVELGPRRRVKVTEPVEIDEALLEAVLAAGAGLTAVQIASLLHKHDDVIPEWLSLLAELSRHPVIRWRVGAWWNSPDESPSARWLEVVETDAGSLLVTRHRREDRRYRRVRLYPLTSTQIWRLLCALLPAPEEVAGPLLP